MELSMHLQRTTSSGLPLNAILASSTIGLLAYLNLAIDSSAAFTWLVSIATQSGFLSWWSICLTYIRFDRGMKAQGLDRRRLFYYGRFQPFCAWYGLVSVTFLILICGFTSFIGEFDVKSFVANYVGLPVRLRLLFEPSSLTISSSSL